MSPSKCSAQRMQSPLQLRVLLQGYTTGKVNLKVTQGFFPNSRSQSLSMTPPSPGSTRKAPRHRAGLTSEGTAPGAVSSCGPSPPPRTDGTSFSQAARLTPSSFSAAMGSLRPSPRQDLRAGSKACTPALCSLEPGGLGSCVAVTVRGTLASGCLGSQRSS